MVLGYERQGVGLRGFCGNNGFFATLGGLLGQSSKFLNYSVLSV
jgi:hypothetical protein